MKSISPNILSHFPGTPRPVQKAVLLSLERKWKDYDVFVIQAPTASGKSRIAMTISSWQKDVDIITPTNILLQQYVKEFPKFPKAIRHNFYPCYGHCSTLKKGYSSRCEYMDDRRRVRSESRGFMNYYMYMSMNSGWQTRIVGSKIVIDESHNLIPTIQALEASKLWRHQWHWPSTLSSYDDLLKWCKQTAASGTLTIEKQGKIEAIIRDLDTFCPKYVFEKTKELWKRPKVAEKRDVILLKPVDIREATPYFWQNLGRKRYGVNKVVLMSATINKKDIEALGLDKHRVLYLECESAIEASRRPVWYTPITAVTHASIEYSAKKLGEHIRDVIAPHHLTEKGLIHATYEMSTLLRKHLEDDDRYIFHNKWNKQQKYQEYLKSGEPKILVASGLYEGIDLPGDLGRWQVIAKVPWLSLGDRAIKYKSEINPEWYSWNCIRDLCQASGRICRTPTDYGITYLVDSTFERLLQDSAHLFPKAFKEALEAGKEHTQ